MDSGTVKNVKNRKKNGKKSRKNATRKKLKHLESLGGATISPPPVPPRTYLTQQQTDKPLESTVVVEPNPQNQVMEEREAQEVPVASDVNVDAEVPLLDPGVRLESITQNAEVPVASDVNAEVPLLESITQNQEERETPEVAGATNTEGATVVDSTAELEVNPEEVQLVESEKKVAGEPGEMLAASSEKPEGTKVTEGTEGTKVTEGTEGTEGTKVTEGTEVRSAAMENIKTALLEELKKIQEEAEDITKKLNEGEYTSTSGGMMKKRKKTFYKRYKSKKSMKRRNKTNRNN